MWKPRPFLAPGRAAVLLTALGCSGDPAGPGLVGDDLRVPLTAAIDEAERTTNFVAFGGLFNQTGLNAVAIAQMAAAGTHDRSRDDEGVATDPISQDHYGATAYIIDYDIVLTTGQRRTGQILEILSWAGLDRNRGTAEALMSVLASQLDGPVTTGIYGGIGTEGIGGAGSFYYFRPEGRTWENSPGIEVELSTLTQPSSERECRGTIPETVSCVVSATPGRATGAFEFFGSEVTRGMGTAVFHFQPTAFDLPVTGLRIVDTLRFAGP